jgi:hypothetical protein
MDLKPGTRLKSAVCTAEFVVVRGATGIDELNCGGAPLVAQDVSIEACGPIAAGLDGGVGLGKRYFDEKSGLELLASKAGLGSLTVDGRRMAPKEAKPLPSSD